MDLRLAEEIAVKLMLKHGLGRWGFTFDNARRRFGAAHWGPTPKITLSRHLVALNDLPTVVGIIKHEIAHALAGRYAGHGTEWRAQAHVVGCELTRCYGAEVTRPPGRLSATCRCGASHERNRRPKRVKACRYCGDILRWRIVR